MDIGVSSHTGDGDEIKVVDPVVENMDNYLKDKLKNVDYGGGINGFLIVPYVVFTDEIENENFAKASHKIQKTKNYYGDQSWVKTMVFALPFNPDNVSKMSLEKFRINLCNSVLKCLINPGMKILKAFNYEKFKDDMSKIIEEYKIMDQF